MNKSFCYYNWFQKIIAIFIEIFFVCAVLSTLYVFTYAFNESIKLYVYIGILITFGVFAYLFKNKIYTIIKFILLKFERLNTKQMILIITITMIILKTICTCFCYFDPSLGDGDIVIYDQMATDIISGSLSSNSISHLIGIASHLALFKILNIPYHTGIFVLFLIATAINFYSFNRVVGKEKSFLLIMLYILMPSTILLTFCPTHELFVYFYFSLFIYILNNLINNIDLIKTTIYSILLIIVTALVNFVNPAGYIGYIILGLLVLFSTLKLKKKILITIILIFSIVLNNTVTSTFNSNSLVTKSNTYSILIHGSNIYSLGEHVDHYPTSRANAYLEKYHIEETLENQVEAYKIVLAEQYKYILTHPMDLVRLLTHKFYVEWSGDHYSIEMAHNCGSINDILYYILLGISAIIYLFVITVGLIFASKKEDTIDITNYKLLLLGVVGLLLISLVLNKYSVYATIFIYLIAFYRIGHYEK